MSIKENIISRAQDLGSTANTYKGALRYLVKHLRENKTPFTCILDKGVKVPVGFFRRKTRSEWYSCKSKERHAKARINVPLGENDRTAQKEWAEGLYPRRKNWTIASSTTEVGVQSVKTIDCGSYSRRCFYRKYRYEPIISSWALIRSKSQIEYAYGSERYKDGKLVKGSESSLLDAPHGYHWDRDSNGLRLVANRNDDYDYHPNSDDLNRYSKKAISTKVRENARKRKALLKKKRQSQRIINRAQREGLRVCLADSVRAGNCETGSRTWVIQHGLDPDKHYTPKRLMAMANGNADRVAVAVQSALRRHQREMSQGYALLEDHRVT